jgi:hypothetical protein
MDRGEATRDDPIVQGEPEPAAVERQTASPGGGMRNALSWARAEDWLLALWLVLVVPVVDRLLGHPAPFQSGRPLDGLFEMAAVIGAAGCIATRSADGPPGGRAVTNWFAVGPAVGGLILVYLSGTAALDGSTTVAWLALVVAVAFAVGLRLRHPLLPTRARRALITPYILVTGTLFSGIVRTVTEGSGSIAGTFSGLASNLTVLAFFIVFTAVYYAMLVYAPRQLAEPEGSAGSWLARYVLFLVALVVGIGL